MCKGSGIRNTAYEQITQEYTDFMQILKDSKKLKETLNEILGTINEMKADTGLISTNIDDIAQGQVEIKVEQ